MLKNNLNISYFYDSALTLTSNLAGNWYPAGR